MDDPDLEILDRLARDLIAAAVEELLSTVDGLEPASAAAALAEAAAEMAEDLDTEPS